MRCFLGAAALFLTAGLASRGQVGQILHMPETLHGKVVMEDGTPPPERVVIEQVCWGIVSRAAYTDPKGQFMIHEGQQFPGAQDASAIVMKRKNTGNVRKILFIGFSQGICQG